MFSLNTPLGREVVRKLEGKHFDALIAHSNGATVTEALIRRGVITVDRLEVAGGDRSFSNLNALQQLIDSGMVKSVRVWINPGDPIPLISSTPLSLPMRNEALYWAGRLVGAATQPVGSEPARIEVCVTDGAVGQSFGVGSHDLEAAYFPNMAAGSCR